MRMLSTLASVMRGSVGGLTFFAGPHHAIQVRARVAPVQPQTDFRTAIKVAFSSGSAAWEALTDAVREDWEAYAQTVTLSGPLGSYQPKGRDLAIGQFALNGYMDFASGGVTVFQDDMEAPVLAGQLAVTNLEIVDRSAVGVGFRGQAKNTGNGEAVTLIAQKSANQSQARNFFKGPFRANTWNDIAVDDGLTAGIDFGGNFVGAVTFCRCRFLSNLPPYRMSPVFILKAVLRETTV